MIDENLLFKKTLTCVVILLLLPPTTLIGQIGGEELASLLRQKDQLYHSGGYKVSFVVAGPNPFKDPNQGMVIKDCTATCTAEGSFAMKVTFYYEHPPVYLSPGSAYYARYGYDRNGNYIVWRSLEEQILSTHDRNDTIQKLRAHSIDPNNQIVETGDNVLLYRFPIDKPYRMYQFNQYEMGMGRGFSRHLGAVKSTKLLSSGLLRVASEGSYGGGFQGTWELTLDPNSDSLVRKAVFTPKGADKPITEVTTSGVVTRDGLTMAKYGVLKHTGFVELSIEVTGIYKVVGPNHFYAEVFTNVTKPLPIGAVIMDFRGKEPVRTTVRKEN